MKRNLFGTVVLAVVGSLFIGLPVATAADRRLGVHWDVPMPLGWDYNLGLPPEPSAVSVTKPVRRLELPVSESSLFEVRRAKFVDWGTKRAIIKGRVRFCDDACGPWQRGRIVLTHRFRLVCGTGPQLNYMEYRLRGFDPYYDGKVFTSDSSSCAPSPQ